jgi:simple sugar transport system permease protein
MNLFDADLLLATIIIACPLVLASTGELISQRSGVINIGLEGMILAGSFFSFWAYAESGSATFSFLIGALAGATLGLLMGSLTTLLLGNQIVVGFGIWIFAIGTTDYFYVRIYSDLAEKLPDSLANFNLAIFENLPFVNLLSRIPLPTYLAFLLVPIMSIFLFKTKIGLKIRAAGEMPRVLFESGSSIKITRHIATVIAGAFAGLAGSLLVIVEIGNFTPRMSAGRGFLAIAAVLFGISLILILRKKRGNLSLRSTSINLILLLVTVVSLSTFKFSLPSQFWLSLPFMLVVIGMCRKSFVAGPRFLGRNFSENN